MAPTFLVIGDIKAKLLDKLHIYIVFHLWYNLGYYSVLSHDTNNYIDQQKG